MHAESARAHPQSSRPVPLLEVNQLGVAFRYGQQWLNVVEDVSFSLMPGETIGLVGESGSGKTVTGLSILRLLPGGSARNSGQVMFEGRDLLALPESEMRAIRGRRISMVFQEPMTALDPVFTVGQQLIETLRAHFRMSRREAREKAVDALAQVGIPLPARRVDEYPHQLSGGMRQRVMIAIALACEPSLLIADEPTTALDVTIQAQIIELLQRLIQQSNASLIFISHNLGVVAQSCDRMVTMYAGQVVEDGAIDNVLEQPRHPYTAGLLASMPRLAAHRARLASIGGRVPSPEDMPAGCRFAPRCTHAQASCAASQLLSDAGSGHLTRCMRHDALTLAGAVA